MSQLALATGPHAQEGPGNIPVTDPHCASQMLLDFRCPPSTHAACAIVAPHP